LGELIVEAECSNDEEANIKYVDVAWGFDPSISQDDILSCYAMVDCFNSDNVTVSLLCPNKWHMIM